TERQFASKSRPTLANNSNDLSHLLQRVYKCDVLKLWRPVMQESVIFRELPATFPEKDKYKAPAAAGAVIVQILLLTTFTLFPLFLRARTDPGRCPAFVAPCPPPPPPPPAPVQLQGGRTAAPVQPMLSVNPSALIMPVEVPKEIARIVDEPAGELGGVVG